MKGGSLSTRRQSRGAGLGAVLHTHPGSAESSLFPWFGFGFFLTSLVKFFLLKSPSNFPFTPSPEKEEAVMGKTWG